MPAYYRVSNSEGWKESEITATNSIFLKRERECKEVRGRGKEGEGGIRRKRDKERCL